MTGRRRCVQCRAYLDWSPSEFYCSEDCQAGWLQGQLTGSPEVAVLAAQINEMLRRRGVIGHAPMPSSPF